MGKCYFNASWLSDERYRDWLSEGKSNQRAVCTLCSKDFDVANMGEAAVKSHATSKKHLTMVDLNKKKGKSNSILKMFGAAFGKKSSSSTVQAVDSTALSNAPSTSGSGLAR